MTLSQDDIRWQQRFSNYRKAYTQLKNAIAIERLNDLEQEGLIQRFEYTFELAWNVMKDFLEAKGNNGIMGSRDAIRLAFKQGLISDGEIWMEMVKSRVLSSHTYDEETADEVTLAVRKLYYPLLTDFLNTMDHYLLENDNE